MFCTLIKHGFSTNESARWVLSIYHWCYTCILIHDIASFPFLAGCLMRVLVTILQLICPWFNGSALEAIHQNHLGRERFNLEPRSHSVWPWEIWVRD